ncbi:Phage derived protein Gp49-like [Granulicella rosea]|uniref:Phage derived protein Gp49-like n=2 Tax=Granulicella rosea TaxID=474952 RepID=A0A239M803_9BACT|nr:Phage derived protein Gp49-like [Granulicella rosea]
MKSVGAGVSEIRIRDEQGIYRIIYVAKFASAIFVLHAFQKKTQKTAFGDLAVAIKRYKELQKEQSR